MKIRVVQRPDGQVSIIRAADPGDFEAAAARAIEQSAETAIPLVGLPYVDLDDAELPARVATCRDDDCTAEHDVRDQWSLIDGAVVVDDGAPNARAALDHAARRLDALLEEDDAPDGAEVTRLQRHIQRLVPLTHGACRDDIRAEIARQRVQRPSASIAGTRGTRH